MLDTEFSNFVFEKLHTQESLPVANPSEYVRNTDLLDVSYFLIGSRGIKSLNALLDCSSQSPFPSGVIIELSKVFEHIDF